ncbi:ADP-ribosylglycohydrolase family protein [Oribacterium sp. WCC10]|uniref:ADP-ribosylglycohydrolase family protein n=1 Tax=Oribacterium sp. WCC10 TaxID=1855343 RepID=UPI0008E29C11|nr:ADP-ribosylglycohydrolase family protein [Oribacterium sp. WCC10]SFG43247.1 ADP-ribosylglycohydrolase [Oribacterium sp. WCC10]
MVNNYVEKIYAGFLGMNIGIRLGAPVEPTIWTYDRIRKTYGEITSYVKEYKNFAADDDVNGPVYFLRALIDSAHNRPLEPQDVANAWLNYTREGVGMFWWGGYGVSTEHTAYLNLKSGIPAPQSGSIEQNGIVLAEQIGGQIFIDTWGFVNPCNPTRAADYGEKAASVSHDGNGKYGARFVAAAISKAFETSDVNEIISAALDELPSECLYRNVVEAVIAFHEKHPEDWHLCQDYLLSNWGYDRYPGVCHIIPNAGAIIMSLLYGNGKFDRSIEIATMNGWDTDCNAGNVGSIMGVACSLDEIPDKYREPINDGIILSGISGYLNNLNIPSYVREIALLGYRLAGEEAPQSLVDSYNPHDIYFDFELPGSTSNIRLSDHFLCRESQSTDVAYKGKGSLKILMDRFVRGQQCKVFYKPFYTRDDFSDERYSPVFSPTVHSGQTLSVMIYLDQWNGNETPGVAPYIRTCNDRTDHIAGYVKLVQGKWINLSWTLPDTDGDVIDEVGFVLEGYSPAKSKTLAAVYIDEFKISGKANYTIDTSKQKKNFASVTPFSTDHGAWDLYGGTLNLMRNEPAFAYTGNYYAKDYELSAIVTPHHGTSHLLVGHSLGAQMAYYAGLGSFNKAVIQLNNYGIKTIAETCFPWEFEKKYLIKLIFQGKKISMFINDEKVLEAENDLYDHGMFGCGSLELGRTSFNDFRFKEL